MAALRWLFLLLPPASWQRECFKPCCNVAWLGLAVESPRLAASRASQLFRARPNGLVFISLKVHTFSGVGHISTLLSCDLSTYVIILITFCATIHDGHYDMEHTTAEPRLETSSVRNFSPPARFRWALQQCTQSQWSQWISKQRNQITQGQLYIIGTDFKFYLFRIK